MYDVVVVAAGLPLIAVVSAWSFAIVTSYVTAPSTGFQVRSSGCVGNDTDALSAGETSCGGERHAFVNVRVTHGEIEPLLPTARIRHQYLPSGSVLLIVAIVLRVWKCPRLPSSSELKPVSPASSNS